MAQRNGNDRNGQANAILELVKSNKEVLASAAVSAVGAVAASKGHDLMQRLTETTENRGEEGASKLGAKAAEGAKERLGSSGILGSALSKTLGGAGGGKKTRRLPIQRWTDVAVPLEQAYEAWTKFDEYPKFMHRVL